MIVMNKWRLIVFENIGEVEFLLQIGKIVDWKQLWSLTCDNSVPYLPAESGMNSLS